MEGTVGAAPNQRSVLVRQVTVTLTTLWPFLRHAYATSPAYGQASC
jgi:hypothetical protein